MIQQVFNLYIKKLVSFYENYDFSRVIIAPADNTLECKNQFDFTNEDYAKYAEKLEEIIPHIVNKSLDNDRNAFFPHLTYVKKILNGSLSLSIPLARCQICHSSITVDPLGDFYPCSKFYGMKHWKVGNVKEGFDYERCKKLWIDYRNSVASHCDSCWAYAICKGPCPWTMSKSNGLFNTYFSSCIFVKKFIEQAAYITTTLTI